MADEKKQTKKSPRKANPAAGPEADTDTTTTADNEDFIAADDSKMPDRAIYFFTGGPEADRLPPIGDQNWIGRLADISYWSGLFGDATPAQLAIRILTGDALGLRPANSLFDLAIVDGRVTWGRGDYQNTADAIAINAGGDAVVEENAGSGVDGPAAANVVQMRPAAAQDENANKSPVLPTTAEPLPDGLEAKQTQGSPQSGETATESASIGDRLPGGADLYGKDPSDPGERDRAIDAEFDRVTTPNPEPSNPFESPAEPPATTSSLVGLDVEATLSHYRSTIADKLADLGFGLEKRTEKLKEFDAKDSAGKKAMFDQCETMHAERLKSKRDWVLEALRLDGKDTAEARKGFCFFAEVPEDPFAWNYTQAATAARILEKDFPEAAARMANAS